jgi:preprotein translocase subunit SecA
MEHLETMADVRSGIGLQSYAQRNPLVEYKNIAFSEFEGMMEKVDQAVVNRIFKVARVANRDRQALKTNDKEISDVNTGDREMTSGNDKLKEMVDKISGVLKEDRCRQMLLADLVKV